MQNRRLLFTVIIKILVLIGLLLLTLVFVNSLFTGERNTSKLKTIDKPVAKIKLADMQSGQIKKTRWDDKEVAVLLRQFPEKLEQIVIGNSIEDLPPSIKPQTRSRKNKYFVYFNVGDSKTCPLYYAGGIFKDTCSSNRFDEAGRDIKANLQSYMLKIPPHYFDNDTVIFGKWQP